MVLDVKTVWILVSMVFQILAMESFLNPLNSVHVLRGSIVSIENLDRVHCVVEVEDLLKSANTKRRIIWTGDVQCPNRSICELDLVIPNEALITGNHSPLGSTALLSSSEIYLFCQWWLNHTHVLLWNSELLTNGLVQSVEFAAPIVKKVDSSENSIHELIKLELMSTHSNHSFKQHTSVNSSGQQSQKSNEADTKSVRSLKQKPHFVFLELKIMILVLILILTLVILEFTFLILRSRMKTSQYQESTIEETSNSPSCSIKAQSSLDESNRGESEMELNKRWRREGGRLIRRSNQNATLDSIQSLNTTASIIFRRTRDDYHNSITTLNSSSNSNIFF